MAAAGISGCQAVSLFGWVSVYRGPRQRCHVASQQRLPQTVFVFEKLSIYVYRSTFLYCFVIGRWVVEMHTGDGSNKLLGWIYILPAMHDTILR